MYKVEKVVIISNWKLIIAMFNDTRIIHDCVSASCWVSFLREEGAVKMLHQGISVNINYHVEVPSNFYFIQCKRVVSCSFQRQPLSFYTFLSLT